MTKLLMQTVIFRITNITSSNYYICQDLTLDSLDGQPLAPFSNFFSKIFYVIIKKMLF